jgi:hypothetical protein
VANDTEYDTPDIEQRNAPQGAQVIQLESSRLVPVLVALSAIGLVLAGLALGVAFWARDEARRAEMRADQLQLEVESFKNVLHAAHLPTAAHLPGESP